jgi:dihydroorotate dehydrogenase
MLEAWFRRSLLMLPPERAHAAAMAALELSHTAGLTRHWVAQHSGPAVSAMGLTFDNPVGLAAGFDKDGDHIDALGALGFGHLEVGTVTPKPQPGNPAPRLFRLPEHQALINRMGFNNQGVDHLVERLKARQYRGIIGANIGRQKDTPTAEAAGDYRHCLERVYPYCDYITVNISSPNTPNLRALQDTVALKELLDEMTRARQQQIDAGQPHRPLVIKIAPDWVDQALTASLEVIAASGFEGLIATNTTLDRQAVTGHRHADEAGGLSGQPLRHQADAILQRAKTVLGDHLTLIGAGGIGCGEDAERKRTLGADLVQVYTGFIYRGPPLVAECAQAWATDDAA